MAILVRVDEVVVIAALEDEMAIIASRMQNPEHHDPPYDLRHRGFDEGYLAGLEFALQAIRTEPEPRQGENPWG